MNNPAKIILVFIAVCAIVSGSYFVLTQPPSIEYLKEHPEEFRFHNYKKEEKIVKAIEALFPLGSSKSKVDKIFVSTAGAFKTLEYFQDEELRLHPRRSNKDYLVIYYMPDDVFIGEDKHYDWLGGPGWEVWAVFNPDNQMKSFHTHRMDYKYTIVQKNLLSKNPENHVRRKE